MRLHIRQKTTQWMVRWSSRPGSMLSCFSLGTEVTNLTKMNTPDSLTSTRTMQFMKILLRKLRKMSTKASASSSLLVTVGFYNKVGLLSKSSLSHWPCQKRGEVWWEIAEREYCAFAAAARVDIGHRTAPGQSRDAHHSVVSNSSHFLNWRFLSYLIGS